MKHPKDYQVSTIAAVSKSGYAGKHEEAGALATEGRRDVPGGCGR